MEARDFSTSTAYAKGNLVLYGGRLYRFTANHSAGAWTGSDVEEVDSNAQQELNRLLTRYETVEKTIQYAGTVVFEPAQITGTRYKYVLTNAADPR